MSEKKTSEEENVSRRTWLKVAGGTVAGVVVGAALDYGARPTVTAPPVTVTNTMTETVTGTMPAVTSAVAPTESPFKGQTIRIILQAVPDSDAMKLLAPIWEAGTGAKIIIDDTPYEHLQEKEIADLSAGTGAYDIVDVDSIWVEQYVNAGWLMPLDDYIKKPPWLFGAPANAPEMNDYDPRAVDTYQRGGVQYLLPHWVCHFLNVYRKDLYQKDGISPPSTIADYLSVAKHYNNPPSFYGTAMQAKRTALTDEWLAYLWGHGGDLLGSDMYPIFNNDAAVAATEDYITATKYAPPGVVNWEFGEAETSFATGQVASSFMWSILGATFENPALSKMVGKVGWSTNIMGRFGSHGLSIPKAAKNKDLAYNFMEWWTSRRMEKAVALAGGNPQRLSAYNDPDLQAKFPNYPALAKIYTTIKEVPRITVYSQAIDDNIALGVSEAIVGQKTVKQALDDAVARATDALKTAGYIKG